ncbi:CC_3452 family protein [Phenylobacterium sp.]|uniref:CC_3452 family protein n=1 Tax=Phenylobacterium sp. TaxID=1871053 RepID=UPI002FE0E99A
MQNFSVFGAIAAAAVFVSGAAYAQAYSSEAKLAQPAAAPQEATIAGVAWRCEGDACKGAAERKANVDGLMRECRKVVAVIGPVSSYRSQGRELSAGQVRACNKGAIQIQTARN